MGILKARETLCECGKDLLYGVLTQKNNLLYNIVECNICHNVYIVKSKPEDFKQFTKEQFNNFAIRSGINIEDFKEDEINF